MDRSERPIVPKLSPEARAELADKQCAMIHAVLDARKGVLDLLDLETLNTAPNPEVAERCDKYLAMVLALGTDLHERVLDAQALIENITEEKYKEPLMATWEIINMKLDEATPQLQRIAERVNAIKGGAE